MSGNKALEGIRILDFTWQAAGPQATKLLALYGAEVIRVESQSMVDSLRFAPPLAGTEEQANGQQVNRGYWFANVNAHKHSIALNMKRPEARGLARRLAASCDIVFSNMSSGTLDRWGMGYDDLVKLRPDIIVVHMPIYGKTGPRREAEGYGNHVWAIVGLSHLTTYPGLRPLGTPLNYPDHSTNPYHAAVAMLAALHHRRLTGKGQHVDISQVESMASALDTTILEYTADGHIAQPTGNRSPYAAPHGIYRCAGEDRWCAIAVTSDEEWLAFCGVLGAPSLACDPHFATLEARLKNVQALDRIVEGWTATINAHEVMERLQSAGVPAGVVQDSADLLADPQLQLRGFYTRLEHPEIGLHTYEGPSAILSRTPAKVCRPGPRLGEHTDYVLQHILGLSEEEINGYIIDGVIY